MSAVKAALLVVSHGEISGRVSDVSAQLSAGVIIERPAHVHGET